MEKIQRKLTADADFCKLQMSLLLFSSQRRERKLNWLSNRAGLRSDLGYHVAR
jgi:hypothetical protein